ncbi:ASCH domain-containing protein [Brevibacterium senegalense]|uniref:ASCH domain-containing protein n=1 Tax=Brevibacterium senegalense TaxID=1033736 RepID=UPI0002E0C0C6|nr:ASCH domain-containing protein [Brevibacterium senegalense]
MLAGTKRATASSMWDCEHVGEAIPVPGELSIILDGRDTPRALIETMTVDVVPFDEVTADHARAEGEGDRTLAAWRDIHERFWRDHSEDPRGFDPQMPVVCETFRVLYSACRGGPVSLPRTPRQIAD